MTTPKDRIEAAIRHIQTAADVDPWAMELAVDALKAQGTCEDAVSRQTLQKELALYPIDDVTSEDEAGYNRAINDVQKMVLHLPSAQPDNRLSKIADLVEGTIDHFDLDDAMDLLYQIKDVLDGSDELPSAQPEPKWIPCSERLPEKPEQVLIYAWNVHYVLAKYREIRTGEGIYKMAWVMEDAYNAPHEIKHDVIAWMPLPEPYKGGELE